MNWWQRIFRKFYPCTFCEKLRIVYRLNGFCEECYELNKTYQHAEFIRKSFLRFCRSRWQLNEENAWLLPDAIFLRNFDIMTKAMKFRVWFGTFGTLLCGGAFFASMLLFIPSRDREWSELVAIIVMVCGIALTARVAVWAIISGEVLLRVRQFRKKFPQDYMRRLFGVHRAYARYPDKFRANVPRIDMVFSNEDEDEDSAIK